MPGPKEGEPGGLTLFQGRRGSRAPQERPHLYQELANMLCQLGLHPDPMPHHTIVHRCVSRSGQSLRKEHRLLLTKVDQATLGIALGTNIICPVS